MFKSQLNTLKSAMIALSVLLCPHAKAGPSTAQNILQKREILEKARTMREKNGTRIQDINQRLRQVIETSGANLDTEVSQLKSNLKDHLARQEFWDRIIFQIDTKFSGGDLRQFLQTRLIEMAKIEAASSETSNLWKFFRYTSDVIKTLPERKDDVIAVLEGYVRSTSPINPDQPEKYMHSQNYTNGTDSEPAKTVDRSDVGSLAEERMKKLAQPIEEPTPTTAVARPIFPELPTIATPESAPAETKQSEVPAAADTKTPQTLTEQH